LDAGVDAAVDEERGSLAVAVGETRAEALGAFLPKPEVNHIDGSAAGWDTRDAEEEDVILGDGHDAVIVGGVDLGRSGVRPWKGGGLCGIERSHVKSPKVAFDSA